MIYYSRRNPLKEAATEQRAGNCQNDMQNSLIEMMNQNKLGSVEKKHFNWLNCAL